MNATTANTSLISIPAIPSGQTILRLLAGGLIGTLVWEVWARYLTPPVAGFPLEPPELVRLLIENQTGIAISLTAATILHWIVGIAGYPIAYWIISRGLRGWDFILDAAVWVIFTAYVAWGLLAGKATPFWGVFWIAVTLLTASRFINPNKIWRDAVSWGSFTWFNALGIMAPLAGQPFLLLSDFAPLSFMSWAGHVVFGGLAVLVFEYWNRKPEP